MNKTQYITKVISPAKSWACKQILSSQNGMTVIITEDNNQSYQLERELTLLNKTKKILIIPDYGTAPYKPIINRPSSYYDRIASIYELAKDVHKDILIASIANFFYRIPTKSFFNNSSIKFNIGTIVPQNKIFDFLSNSGYAQTAQTRSAGEFSIRGSIIDVFTPGLENPIRVNFDDTTIERISLFDQTSQLNIKAINQATILPTCFFSTSDESINTFKANYRENIAADIHSSSIYQKVSTKYIPTEIESYLPLFFNETGTLYDLLPNDPRIISISDLSNLFFHYQEIIVSNYELCNQNYYLNPEQLFELKTADLMLNKSKQFFIFNPKTKDIHNTSNLQISCQPIETIYNGRDWFSSILDYSLQKNYKVIFCTPSKGLLTIISELLSDRSLQCTHLNEFDEIYQKEDNIFLINGFIKESFLIEDEAIILINPELFLDKPQTTNKNKSKRFDRILESLEHLSIGEPVIHKRFGLGVYQGLKLLQGVNYSNEFMIIEYADNDILYVPIYDLNLVSKHSNSASSSLKLHKLGSNQWSKARKKSLLNIKDVAIELLNIHAHRNSQSLKPITYNALEYKQFCDDFPYIETEDQLSTLEVIEKEFKAGKLIDRLVCGDVGFGKTEIALRAAYMHILAGFKVVVLVPTTILAKQHYETFHNRFKEYAINIELISRLQSDNKNKDIINQVTGGKVDLLIATHKILSNRQLFKYFKLIIIDEEHRFGVRQKEILTSMRADQNLISLTATPIPRTLNLTLNGIRDISIISTPPPNKKNIFTQHIEFSTEVIVEASKRELKRGGQIYFVHNRVKSLDKIKSLISDILPDVNISVAHGQMPILELTTAIDNFNNRQSDVLLCTSIIQSGIDNHNVNTIFINDADIMGIAQIHQLRGRVGRGSENAYAYIITKPLHLLTPEGKKRIEAIESMSDLGSGFLLAAQDLEIRGAGEVLGAKQSGDIQEIGFNYYNELLGRAIDALRSGKDPTVGIDLNQGIEINLGVTALIPDFYIPDINLRLNYYKRIASDTDYRSIKIELIDLFGLIPQEVECLILLSQLKKLMRLHGIIKLNGSLSKFKLSLLKTNNINSNKVMEVIYKEPSDLSIKPIDEFYLNITIKKTSPTIEDIIKLINDLTT